MKIKDFIAEYKTASDDHKAHAINKHIVKKYVPYIEKVASCQMIVENSMYIKDEYGKVFQPNTPLRFQMFVGELIRHYTDIDIESGQDRIEIFDAFEENGITELFMQCLGSEAVKFQTVLQMCCDDVTFAETDLVKWVNGKITAAGLGLNALLEAVGSLENGEE